MNREDTSEPTPRLVNRKDTARMLGISERLLWRLSANGSIPTVRIGARVLYRLADIERFIEKGGAK